MLKKGFKSLIKKPSIFFKPEIQSLKFHFDMHHGDGNLDKAINCLHKKDQEDFRKYMLDNVSFHPHIMFITKSHIAEKWFTDLFDWLFKCEKIFGFENLKVMKLLDYMPIWQRDISHSGLQNIQNLEVCHGYSVICPQSKINIFYDLKSKF